MSILFYIYSGAQICPAAWAGEIIIRQLNFWDIEIFKRGQKLLEVITIKTR